MFKKVLIVLSFVGFTFATLDANQLLDTVDSYRGYSERFAIDMYIIDYKGDTVKAENGMIVYVKDRRSSYVQYTSPAVDKDKMLLMVGENMWFYRKNLQKPVPITQRQRLLGNASNADVARANFSEDYKPTIIASSVAVDDKKTIQLELRAKNDGAAYGKIILWLDEVSYKPLKGEFYAISEKLLKTVNYKSFKLYNGEEKIAELDICDAITKENKTTLKYKNYTKKIVPDYYFNVDYLPRL